MSDVMPREDVDRHDENWKYPYVAGVIDFGSTLNTGVRKAQNAKVGYSISPKIMVSHKNTTGLGFLDEFCANHDIDTNHQERSNSYRLVVRNRNDVEHLLRLVRPYVIARHDEIEIMLRHLLPGLELGKASSKEGFIELMEYVDEIREHTNANDPKYDQAYFLDEWDL